MTPVAFYILRTNYTIALVISDQIGVQLSNQNGDFKVSILPFRPQTNAFNAYPYTGIFKTSGNDWAGNVDKTMLNSTLDGQKCPSSNTIAALWNRFHYQPDSNGILLPAKNITEYHYVPEDFFPGESLPFNYSAVFCEPRYFQQKVTETVDAITLQIIGEPSIIGEKTSFDSGLNKTPLADIAASGGPTVSTAVFNVSEDLSSVDGHYLRAPDTARQMLSRQAFQTLLKNGTEKVIVNLDALYTV